MDDEANSFTGHNLVEVQSWLRQYWPESPFEALDIPQDASDSEIRKAYMKQARLHRQAFVSKNAEDEMLMSKINSAYEIISDEETKRIYFHEASTYQSPSTEEHTDVCVDDASTQPDILPEDMIAELVQVYIELDEVIAAGFDVDAYVTAHPNFYRSFFGFSFKGVKMAYAFSWLGFVFYTNRGTLLQKLFNIIFLGIAGGGSAVLPEVICIVFGAMAFSVLYVMYRRREAQGQADPAHLLPYVRCVLYPIEFILLCITLNNSTSAGASGTAMAIIGIMNFWACLLLTITNYQLLKANDIKEMQELARQYTGDRNAVLHATVTDLILLVDSTVNGIMNRIVVSLSSFLVIAVMWLAVALDVLQACYSCNRGKEKTESEDNHKCYSIIALFSMIAAVATCTHSLAEMRVNCAVNQADKVASEHITRQQLYVYYEQVYYHRQLVFWGRIQVAYQNMVNTLVGLFTKKDDTSEKDTEIPHISSTDDLESQTCKEKEEAVQKQEEKEDACSSSHGGKLYASVVQQEDGDESKKGVSRACSHSSERQDEGKQVDKEDVAGGNIDDLD
mmetsp:Transcript_22042/g.32128  ORF Transcript_22042/g.32128 Transcript_22042/m.32128 type:complete len:562 (-) Transcript_22042:180-1865(-)|eukprot:CAMPEP_0185037888 /NCGR_PEP_ID=MMETSP1103-20130426/32893_1 /TAXON_ID=36769 /ORGANISM="Paraphysomonas bandaiensis, Strain Caron Lab Isolate" /LENGTH=561 /DNA_ID=CAMNT_0027576075 /DNA_START=205 /DNA_END=1890 /DNA_ORIENTATION=-